MTEEFLKLFVYLGRRYLEVDDGGREGGFSQLRRMVDGVAVQDHELQSTSQLEDALDLRLDLGQTRRAGVGPLHDGALGRVVQQRTFRQRNVCHDAGNNDPAQHINNILYYLSEVTRGRYEDDSGTQHTQHFPQFPRKNVFTSAPNVRHHINIVKLGFFTI